MDQNNRVQIGEKLHSYAQFHALPPGTRVGVRAHDPNPFVKFEDGTWENVTSRYGRFEVENNFSLGTMLVISYPEGYNPGPVVPLTLTQYKWQFRDFMFAAQEINGVSFAVVDQAMRELGVTSDLFPLGPGVLIESANEQDRLPEGTIVMTGDPANLARSGLFERHGNRWRRLGLGNLRQPRRGIPTRVEAMPSVTVTPEWWAEVGDGSDAAELIEFKKQAWTVALKVKSSQAWCGTLESSVARVGLDPSVMNQRVLADMSVGDTVNSAQARELPQGTILRWHHPTHPDTRVQWFIRDNLASNQSRTRRVCGYRDDAVPLVHTARHMEIMAFPGDPYFYVEVDLVLGQLSLEPGTLLSYRVTDPAYMIAADHRFASLPNVLDGLTGRPPERGDWDLESFEHPEHLRVCRFGPAR